MIILYWAAFANAGDEIASLWPGSSSGNSESVPGEVTVSLDDSNSGSADDSAAAVGNDIEKDKEKRSWVVGKIGWDLGGDYERSSSPIAGSQSVSRGVTAAFEAYWVDSGNTEVFGLGFEFQSPRSVAGSNGSFGFLSYYITAKLKPIYFESRHNFLTLSVKAGYGSFYSDREFKGSSSLHGGFHYGGGIGLVLQETFIVETTYAINHGTFDSVLYDSKIRYSRFNITAGLNFWQFGHKN